MSALIKHLASVIIGIWLAATLVFFMLRVLPGDVIEAQLTQSGVSPAVINERRELLGLNQPVFTQYAVFLAGLLKGDLGHSLVDGLPVAELLMQRLWPTVTLAVGALAVAVTAGVLLGMLAGLEVGWGLSAFSRVVINLSLALPIYWTGTIVIYLITLLPFRISYAGAGRPAQVVLPALVLGFHTSGAIARVIRTQIAQTLRSDFVRTARAKGLPGRHILLRHILRAGLPPVISMIALQAGFLFGGTVITESLFVRPGIGQLLLSRTIQQDYPVVQGIVILAAFVYILLTTLADVLNRALDPRIRL